MRRRASLGFAHDDEAAVLPSAAAERSLDGEEGMVAVREGGSPDLWN
jgi:hypothetical protein